MVTIRQECTDDIEAREALLDRAFGGMRFRKTAERLREGRSPADGMSFIAEEDDCVVGTVRLWPVLAGRARPALLLGPLAVDDARRGLGIGAALIRCATGAARALGHTAVLLVGDPAYYGRFGFSAEKTSALWLPGPFERHRLLGRELVRGGLDGRRGLITAAGHPAAESGPGLPHLVATRHRDEAAAAHAA
jgi:predicted N-acetyltransferase YhbS